MQTYSFVVRQLSQSIQYVQQQLLLPLVTQGNDCAVFQLADNSQLELCTNTNVHQSPCLPLGKRLLSALERNANLFSHSFAVGAAPNCELPVKLRVPSHADIALCRECPEPKIEVQIEASVEQKSKLWPSLSKVFVELLGHDRYRM